MIDDRRMDDEIIFSISDNEDNNNDAHSSFTSISSKCTTNTEFSSIMPDTSINNDVTITKGTKRRSVGRPSKASLLAEQELRQLTDGPVTRSKLKAQSNRSSMDGSQDISFTPTPTPARRGTRNTRSMTRSPSPTNSVISTASTTVARNTIKRRGSNRIKKPTIILSPTNILEQENVILEELNTSDTSSARYNLRSRLRTPQKSKDSVLETLAETAASLTTTTAVKKGRKSGKKLTLYKIDEAIDSGKMKNDENDEFQFSCPTNANVDSKKFNDNDNDDDGDHDSSFTFSPPHSNIKK
jgi:hypothetical protein